MLKRLLAVVTLALFVCAPALGQNIPAYGMYIQQGDVSQTFFWGRYFVPAVPTASYFLMYNGGDSKPRMGEIGAGLTWDGTTLDAATLGISSITGLQTALDAKLNQPMGTSSQCVRGDGSVGTCPVSGSGTVSSVGVSSSTLTVSGSPVTSSGTIAIGLPSTGTPGTYSGVSTDAQGRVTAGTTRSFSYPTRALNACFQASATRDVRVSYAVDLTVSVTLGGTPRGSVYLRTYTDSACTAGQQTVVSGSGGMPSTLSVVVGLQNLGTISLPGDLPAGAWARIETVNDSGTPTFAARQGQEVLQ